MCARKEPDTDVDHGGSALSGTHPPLTHNLVNRAGSGGLGQLQQEQQQPWLKPGPLSPAVTSPGPLNPASTCPGPHPTVTSPGPLNPAITSPGHLAGAEVAGPWRTSVPGEQLGPAARGAPPLAAAAAVDVGLGGVAGAAHGSGAGPPRACVERVGAGVLATLSVTQRPARSLSMPVGGGGVAASSWAQQQQQPGLHSPTAPALTQQQQQQLPGLRTAAVALVPTKAERCNMFLEDLRVLCEDWAGLSGQLADLLSAEQVRQLVRLPPEGPHRPQQLFKYGAANRELGAMLQRLVLRWVSAWQTGS